MAPPPRAPKVKTLSPAVTNGGIVKKDFFKVKELPPLEDYSRCLLNHDALLSLHDFAVKNPCSRIVKGSVSPIVDFDFRTILTGLEILNSSDPSQAFGSTVHEFQWSHHSFENMFVGLASRFFKPLTIPTDAVHFRRFMSDVFESFIPDSSSFPTPDIFGYIATNFPGNCGKTSKYFSNVQYALRYQEYSRGPFQAMVKSGEAYYSSETSQDPWRIEHPSRPRIIHVPVGVGYSLHAAIQ